MTKTIREVIDRFVLNRTIFKIVMVIFVMITAVPYLHGIIGGYVKIALLYGLLVIGYELLTKKYNEILKNKMNLLLILFCVSYFITVIVNRNSHFSDNFKALIYMGVFFVLLYMYPKKKGTIALIKEVELVSWVVVICIFILSLVSFITFAFSISGHYLTDTGFIYYGMYMNRLWGVYNANTGSTLNAISIMISAAFLASHKGERKYVVCHTVNVVLQYVCLILTGSRAALYTLLAVLLAGAVLTCVRKGLNAGMKKLRIMLACFLTCGVIVISFFAVNFVVKNTVSYVPSIVSILTGKSGEDAVLEKLDLDRTESYEPNEGGVLTGRPVLWKASLKAFSESPVWGIGRENLYERAVGYLSDPGWGPNLLRGGCHNIYICILVSSGVVGFVLMAAFAVCVGVKSIHTIIKNIDKKNSWLLASFLLFALFLVTEVVEARILYQVGVFNVLFWLYCGYLVSFIKECEDERRVDACKIACQDK